MLDWLKITVILLTGVAIGWSNCYWNVVKPLKKDFMELLYRYKRTRNQ